MGRRRVSLCGESGCEGQARCRACGRVRLREWKESHPRYWTAKERRERAQAREDEEEFDAVRDRGKPQVS